MTYRNYKGVAQQQYMMLFQVGLLYFHLLQKMPA